MKKLIIINYNDRAHYSTLSSACLHMFGTIGSIIVCINP